MTLHELIAKLQAIEAEHGPDVVMLCWDKDGYDTTLEAVVVDWCKPVLGGLYAHCSSNTSGAVRTITLA